MKMLRAFLNMITVLLGLTSIYLFFMHNVADAIYCLIWAVLMTAASRSDKGMN